jgi:hypothetical protein
MKKTFITCKNCEENFEEGFQFCPHCGQKAHDELTIGLLFYNTISNYFSFDARFFKSFIPLMFKPGYLAQRFIEGKRLLYLHPAQMYLFISVVFFFLFSFISREQVQNVNKIFKEELKTTPNLGSKIVNNKLDSINIDAFTQKLTDKNILSKMALNDAVAIDSLVNAAKNNQSNSVLDFEFDNNEIDSLIGIHAEDDAIYKVMGMKADASVFQRKLYAQALKFYKQRNGGSILQSFYDTVPLAMFFLLPIFALILKLLYFKSRRFAHHLVFSFYFFSFLFMLFSISIFVYLIWGITGWIIGFMLLSNFIYLLFALKRFYNQGYFWSFIKSGVATFLFLLLVIPFATLIVGLSAFLFY